MAHVDAHRWRTGRSCRSVVCQEPHERDCKVCRPPHGDDCRCKVLAWRTRWRDDQRRPRSQVWERKRDAEAHAAEVESSMNRGTYVDPSRGRRTFHDFAMKDWAPAQDWKETTRDDWPNVYKRLDPLLGNMPLASIDQLTLKRTRAELAKRYAHNTVKLTMAYAGMVMRAAYHDGYIGRDPTAGLKAPKARADDSDGRVTPDQVPTRAEALAILAGTPLNFRAAVALGLAGLRIGEVLGMMSDRIELDTRRVTVNQQMQRINHRCTLTTPKAEKIRTIVVPNVVAVELRRHLRDHPGGILFRGVRGAELLRRDQLYDSAWKPALMAAGMCDRCKADGLSKPGRGKGCTCRTLTFKFHALRHFCASMLLAEGAPITAVAGHIGDTVETVSRVYAHWLRDDRNVPADVLDRVLAPSPASQARHEGGVTGV